MLFWKKTLWLFLEINVTIISYFVDDFPLMAHTSNYCCFSFITRCQYIIEMQPCCNFGGFVIFRPKNTQTLTCISLLWGAHFVAVNITKVFIIFHIFTDRSTQNKCNYHFQPKKYSKINFENYEKSLGLGRFILKNAPTYCI